MSPIKRSVHCLPTALQEAPAAPFAIRVCAAIAVLAAAAAGAPVAAHAQEGGAPGAAAEEAATTLDGVYSAAQADRGVEVFQNTCIECHFEEDFGQAFLESWAGATVGNLMEDIIATMPEDNPGGLPMANYLDVIAYMLSLNSLPSDDGAELTEQNVVDIEVRPSPPAARAAPAHGASPAPAGKAVSPPLAI